MPPRTTPERFWSQVVKTNYCWLWTGNVANNGYGRVGVDNVPQMAHRYAYELLVGPIPEGLHIDHLCRVRQCVNPEHLEPVDPIENIRRGVGISVQNGAKTHCKRGHEFTPENTRPAVRRGVVIGRRCFACAQVESATQYARRKAAASSTSG